MSKYNLSALRTIEAILKVTSQERKDLMALHPTDEVTITFEQQLRAKYGKKKALYEPETVMVRAAEIGQGQILNIEKLRVEKKLMDILKEPENYYKESLQKTDSDKESAVKGSSDATSQGTNFAQIKDRSGTVQSFKEFDYTKEGDKSDQETMKTVMGQPSRNSNAQDGEIQTTEGGEKKDGKMISKPAAKPADQPKEITLTDNDEIKDLHLGTINLTMNRTVTADLTTSQTSSGRDIKSKKEITQETKSYVRAQAVLELQKAKLTNVRAIILNQFASLFGADGGGGLCL